jgi:hypothetical protein
MMHYQVLGSPKSFSARFQASVNKFLQSGALEAVNHAVEKIFAKQQVQNTEAKVSLFMKVVLRNQLGMSLFPHFRTMLIALSV